MCLSNVYEKSPDAGNLLFRNIAEIKADGNTLVMTDLLGIPRRVEGTIKKIDLMDNYIVIEPAAGNRD